MRSRYYCCLPLCVVMAMAQGEVGCLHEAIVDLDDLQKFVGAGGDINLYSPNLEVTKICGKETLKCFKSELFVLDFEFDGQWKQNVSQLIYKLNGRLEHFLSLLPRHLDRAGGNINTDLEWAFAVCVQWSKLVIQGQSFLVRRWQMIGPVNPDLTNGVGLPDLTRISCVGGQL